MIFVKKEEFYYSLNGNKNFTKVAAFDIDWTIIRTKSGNVFPKNEDDWELWNDNVESEIQKLKDSSFKIIFFTNQSGLDKKEKKRKELFTKFSNICKKLGKDIDVFISHEGGYYRKPNTGMWDFMVDKSGNKIDMKKSFYCGDAAGREKDWIKGKKKDFSNSDLYFAHNIGLKFYTPDELFDNVKEIKYKYLHPSFKCNKIKIDPEIDYKRNNLIILIGKPASGKSLVAKYIAEKYNCIILSQDIEKTRKKMETKLKNLIKTNNVIIDSQNPDKKSRKNYINIGKKEGTKIIAIYINVSDEEASYLNKFRTQISKGYKKYVSTIVVRIFNKKFEEPSKEEGFNKIVETKFCKNLLDKKSIDMMDRYYL